MTTNHGFFDLDELLDGARADGLTGDTLDLVISNLNGPTMMQPIGVGLHELGASAITLAMTILDRSGSMDPFAGDLIRAYNEHYLRPLTVTPAVDDILISTILFDDGVELLHGYVHPTDAPPLSPAVYRPRGTTALHDALAGGLTNMVLYSQQLRRSGIAVHGIVLVFTDGEDNASRTRVEEIRQTVEELLAQEIYTFALVGFSGSPAGPLGFKTGSQPTPAQQIAARLGFREALAAGLTPADLSRLFFLASRSAVQVSRGHALQTGVFQ